MLINSSSKNRNTHANLQRRVTRSLCRPTATRARGRRRWSSCPSGCRAAARRIARRHLRRRRHWRRCSTSTRRERAERAGAARDALPAASCSRRSCTTAVAEAEAEAEEETRTRTTNRCVEAAAARLRLGAREDLRRERRAHQKSTRSRRENKGIKRQVEANRLQSQLHSRSALGLQRSDLNS